jgi:hypothetical protein
MQSASETGPTSTDFRGWHGQTAAHFRTDSVVKDEGEAAYLNAAAWGRVRPVGHGAARWRSRAVTVVTDFDVEMQCCACSSRGSTAILVIGVPDEFAALATSERFSSDRKGDSGSA